MDQLASQLENKHYTLKCLSCGKEYDDDGFILDCIHSHEPSLLVSSFKEEYLEINNNKPGFFRYSNWLPALREFPDAGGTVTYKSECLGALLGLSNLWIAFNGYWPEKSAKLQTATFKELEAYSVLSRMPEKCDRVLVVASAGNSGSAFAYVCSKYRIPCLIIVPASGLANMCFDHILNKAVKIVSITDAGDYNDAITLGNACAQEHGFFPEGGVKNVARRDGIGTTILNAVETIGRLPDFYFQAIGSGTGAIAMKETANRIAKHGKFGSTLPRLILSQNLPFVPVYWSWKYRAREFVQIDPLRAKAQIQKTIAKVLSNSHPPYSVRGGIYDSLLETNGEMLVASNREIRRAMRAFEEAEGIDIEPAAGVAVATMIKFVQNANISKNSHLLLHITGGGFNRRAARTKSLFRASPSLEIKRSQVNLYSTVEAVAQLFG